MSDGINRSKSGVKSGKAGLLEARAELLDNKIRRIQERLDAKLGLLKDELEDRAADEGREAERAVLAAELQMVETLAQNLRGEMTIEAIKKIFSSEVLAVDEAVSVEEAVAIRLKDTVVVAHEYIRHALGLGSDAPYRFDHYAECITDRIKGHNDALGELQRQYDRYRDGETARFAMRRGVVRPADFCPSCTGSGVRQYPSTATWRGGIGGCAITPDVCDKCWGTGSSRRTGADLRKMREDMKVRQSESRATALRDAAVALEQLAETQPGKKARENDMKLAAKLRAEADKLVTRPNRGV